MSGAYNPFYVPSLADMAKQASGDANATINSKLGGLPSDSFVTGQYGRLGSSLQGADNAYANQIANTNTIRQGMIGQTDVTAPGATSTAPGDMSSGLNAANAALGRGFLYQGLSQEDSANALGRVHQQQNSQNLNDALMKLAGQRSDIKGTYGDLYNTNLSKLKADAFTRYQAYVQDQLARGRISADAAYKNAQLGISQQNANANTTRANNSGGGKNGKGLTASQALAARRAVYNALDSMSTKGKVTGQQPGTETWSITISTGPNNATPHTVTVPAGWSKDQVLQYAGIPQNLWAALEGSAGGVLKTGSTPGKDIIAYPTYSDLLNAGVERMVNAAGLNRSSALRLVRAYLQRNGITPNWHGPTNPAGL